MRVFKNAIFEVGPGEYVIGVRCGKTWWFIKSLPEKYSDGYKFVYDREKALRMTLDEAKALMSDECVRCYNIFRKGEEK